jgi:hypothetical protein
MNARQSGNGRRGLGNDQLRQRFLTKQFDGYNFQTMTAFLRNSSRSGCPSTTMWRPNPEIAPRQNPSNDATSGLNSLGLISNSSHPGPSALLRLDREKFHLQINGRNEVSQHFSIPKSRNV